MICLHMNEPDPSCQVLFRSSEILWNLLERGNKEEVTAQLSSMECVLYVSPVGSPCFHVLQMERFLEGKTKKNISEFLKYINLKIQRMFYESRLYHLPYSKKCSKFEYFCALITYKSIIEIFLFCLFVFQFSKRSISHRFGTLRPPTHK